MRRYERYKDSALPWVEEIPVHWDVLKGKQLFKQMKRPVKAEDEVVTCFRDGQVTLRSNRRTDGFTNALQEVGYQGVRKGDLVIHAMDAFAGAIGVSDSDGKSTPVYAVCQPLKDAEPYYYAHLLRRMSQSRYILALAKGIRERSTDFRYSEFASLPLPVPPADEQKAIVRYLDKKLEQISTFIANKRRLIELLEEQKNTVINKAVTQGLDEGVPMKDSELEWVGNIPVHWTTVVLRRLVKEHRQGYYTTEGYVDEGIKLLRITDFQGAGNVSYDDCPRVRDAENVTSYLLEKDDFVFARTGGAGLFAHITHIREPIVFASYLIRFKFSPKLVPAYLKFFLLSKAFQEGVRRNIHGGVNQNIHAEDIKNQFIFYPSRAEQQRIVDYLNIEMAVIEDLEQKANQEIALIEEYRTTLISEVVTGKIDVRTAM
jgi:type I restriction enzyme, S subunit